MKSFIKLDDLQNMAVDLITSGDFKKYTSQMSTTNREEFEAGFMQGVTWAAILASQLDVYYIFDKESEL